MRLPDDIEREIQNAENYLDSLPGQHAGSARLRDLRWQVEKFLKAMGWSYSKDKEDVSK